MHKYTKENVSYTIFFRQIFSRAVKVEIRPKIFSSNEKMTSTKVTKCALKQKTMSEILPLSWESQN